MAGSMFFFIITGMALLMTSSTLIYLMRDYGLSYEEGGLLLTVQAAGSIITNYLSSHLAGRFGIRRTLILTAAGFVVSFGLITLTPPLPVLYAGLFLSGLSWGSSNNLINYLIVRETGGHSGRIAAVHTSFSIGAFLAPLATALTARIGISWRWGPGAIAVLSVALVAAAAAMPVEESIPSSGTKVPRRNDFFTDWRFYVFMALLFLYVGVETGTSGWIVAYLSEFRGFSAPAAQSMLSALWISMIAGRLAVSVIGGKVRKARFLMLEGCGVAAGSLALILFSTPALLVAAVLFLGLSMSAFYGMVVSNASYLITHSSRASGLIMAAGSLGASALPFMAGVFAERSGLSAGLWVLAATSGILAILSIVNALGPVSGVPEPSAAPEPLAAPADPDPEGHS